jgi:hypothetical protein
MRSSDRSKRTIRPQIELLEDRLVPAVTQLGSTITALNNTGWYPPDTGVAAGPNYVVETVNERMAIYNKSTGAPAGNPENLGTLFAGFYSGSLGPFDPQVMYDDSAGRFVIAAPTTSGTSGNGPFTAYIDFAVSNTSDPTQGWTTRQIEVDQGGANWVDNGKLGYNADALVYSGNRYGSAGGVMVLSIDKTTLGNSTWTSYLVDESGFSTIPARMHPNGLAAGGPMYFVESSWSGGSSVTVLKMTNVLSPNPSFAPTTLGTNSYAQSSITQPGGGSISFDCRTLDVEWDNNNMAAAWNSQAGSDAAAFWIEFSTNGTPSVTQQGTIQPGSGISTAMPAIAIDAGGDIALTYIQSSATKSPSAYITGRLASDPVNTIPSGNTTEIQPGTASFSGGRIGDYAGLSLDSPASNKFWAANEYGLAGVAGNWGTAIAELQIATNSSVTPPTIDSVTASLYSTTSSSNLSVTAHDATSGGTDLSYSWSVLTAPAGAQAPTFSNTTVTNPSVTFHAAGTYTIQVAVSNLGGTATSGTAGEPDNLTITVTQTATGISVSPATASLLDGTRQTFTATEVDQFGNAMASQPATGFTWSVTGTGTGTITATGPSTSTTYIAPSSGTGSNTVKATADGLTGSATVSYGSVPVAPSSLTATVISSRQVNLSWSDASNNSNNVNGFIIQRSTNGGSWVQIATVVGANANSYSDTTVQKRHTYQYRIAAYNSFGNSGWTTSTTVSTPNHDPGSTDSGDQAVVWVGPTGENDSWHRFSFYRQLS